jgi:hypothetical protein
MGYVPFIMCQLLSCGFYNILLFTDCSRDKSNILPPIWYVLMMHNITLNPHSFVLLAVIMITIIILTSVVYSIHYELKKIQALIIILCLSRSKLIIDEVEH